MKDVLYVKEELLLNLKWIDFHHVCILILVGTDKSISKRQKIQNKELHELS